MEQQQNQQHNGQVLDIGQFVDNQLQEAPQDMMGVKSRQQRRSPSLENLFSNKDVLAKRLKNRPDRDSLIERHIIPAQHATPGIYDKVTQLERRKTSDILQKKIRVRPNRQQLVQRHILQDARVDPSLFESLGKLERQRIADRLSERLQQRPGPIELIQEKIIPVDSPIQHVVEQYEEGVASPTDSSTDSSTILELENQITTLNCASPPSPPLTTPSPVANQLQNPFGDSFKGNLKTAKVSPPGQTSSYLDSDLIIRSISGEWPKNTKLINSQSISMSQRENEKLVKTVNKKTRIQNKPKVKKLKFHECRPADMRQTNKDEHIDARYKRLLEQQTMYLRLQVMQQNAMLNALHGNTQPMEAVTEEIENVVGGKERTTKKPEENFNGAMSLDGKKLDDMKVVELRRELKQRGLLVSGSKARLIDRLVAFEEGRSNPLDFNQYYNKESNLVTNPSPTTNIASTPTSTPTLTSANSSQLLQVTTYAAEGGKTYQVIQAVPASTNNNDNSVRQLQVLPASYISSQQVQHMLQPLSALTDPPYKQETKNDQQLQFQLSPAHPAPTVMYQQPPNPQYAQHEKPPPRYFHSNGITYMTQQQPQQRQQVVSPQQQEYSLLSQSVPSTMEYASNYIISPSPINIAASLGETKPTPEMLLKSQQQYRERSISEPFKSSSFWDDSKKPDSSMLSIQKQNYPKQDQQKVQHQKQLEKQQKEQHKRQTKKQQQKQQQQIVDQQNQQHQLIGQQNQQHQLIEQQKQQQQQLLDQQKHQQQRNQKQQELQHNHYMKSPESDVDIIDIIGELSTPSPLENDHITKSEEIKDEDVKNYNCLFANQRNSKSELNEYLDDDTSKTAFHETLPSPFGTLHNEKNIADDSLMNVLGQQNEANHQFGDFNSSFLDFPPQSPMDTSAGGELELDSFVGTNNTNNTNNSINNRDNIGGWMDMETDELQFHSVSPKDILDPFHTSYQNTELTSLNPNVIQQDNYFQNSNLGNINNNNNMCSNNDSRVFPRTHSRDQFVSLFDLENGEY